MEEIKDTNYPEFDITITDEYDDGNVPEIDVPRTNSIEKEESYYNSKITDQGNHSV